MTNKQKIEIRISEVRQRLNAIAGLEGDAFTDEIRGEAGALQTEYNDLETRHRAAIVAEGEEENRMGGEFGTGGESAERRALWPRTVTNDKWKPSEKLMHRPIVCLQKLHLVQGFI